MAFHVAAGVDGVDRGVAGRRVFTGVDRPGASDVDDDAVVVVVTPPMAMLAMTSKKKNRAQAPKRKGYGGQGGTSQTTRE